jgi:hypothetical protein
MIKGVAAEKTYPQTLPAHPPVTAPSTLFNTLGRSFVSTRFAKPMGVSLTQRFPANPYLNRGAGPNRTINTNSEKTTIKTRAYVRTDVMAG